MTSLPLLLSLFLLALPSITLGCSEYSTTGWHDGSYLHTYKPTEAPNGVQFTWRQCAKLCAEYQGCQFWTLQQTGEYYCMMMANKGAYHNSGGHSEGDRDESCLYDSPKAGGWVFSWSDEFNGTQIDPQVWGYETGYVRNNEAQYYTTRLENSRIEDDMMLIDAEEDYWKGHQYTSASRKSQNKKSWLYGRFSIRARIDYRMGSWPAWWWLPNKGGWPKGGEIDMMEYYQDKLLFNVMDGNQRWSSVHAPLNTFGGPTFSDHFHIWTWEWDSDRIKLSIDGLLMNDYAVSKADGTGPNGENPFRQPGYIVINQAIGGNAGGNPSNTQFPVKYYVDYMRIWQWNDSLDSSQVANITVTYGDGTGNYAIGTPVTISARPPYEPSPGSTNPKASFYKWIVTGLATLADDASPTTTFVAMGTANITATFV